MGVREGYCKFLKTDAATPVQLNGSTGNISASFNSEAYDILLSYGYSIAAKWTGDAVGTFKIQCANTVGTPGSPAAADWTDVDGSELALTAGSPIVWNFIDVNYRWFRFVYTRTSGDLVPTISVTAKG